MLSLISQLGLLCLGVSFFSNMIAQRNGVRTKREVTLKEDVLRAARVVLPAINFAISKARELFSREPSMTLKGSLSASLAQNCIRCTLTKYARKVKMQKHGYWKHGSLLLCPVKKLALKSSDTTDQSR
ncbi:hypothetical protein M8C21_008010 [Ambrosia artemisiifolia]|uniref:Secreted protein n=1 Tax=Ambrosia artemisiifolia TaxID=4212 RepID=A0AAD5G2E3_AMBAR|nr:hypothetical protein M8C21_008010 [Ambrosia artemisiifolia]